MVWMLENVMKVYKPEANLFPQCFHKLLFMTQIEDYWRVDGWPDEASRNLYVKATQEIPLLQDTLVHIFVIGISKQHPINGRDIIETVECLVKRAAGLHPLISEDFQVRFHELELISRKMVKFTHFWNIMHCFLCVMSTFIRANFENDNVDTRTQGTYQ